MQTNSPDLQQSADPCKPDARGPQDDCKQVAEQLARQRKYEQRAQQNGAAAQRRIREMGRESALPYGQAIYKNYLELLAAALESTFEDFVLNPGKARANGDAIPYFDLFKGVHHIAAVTLTASLDQLSRKQRLATFCQNLGRAIENECRLMRLAGKSPLELRRLMRQGLTRRKLASHEVMRQLGCSVPAWTDMTRLHVGQFLLDHLHKSTPIVRVVKHRVGRTTPRFVLPTAEVEEFIRSCPQRTYSAAHTAMVCKPEPWDGLYGGGFLGNEESFVRVPVQDIEERDTTAIEHYRKADLSIQFAAATHMQNEPLLVDNDMPQLQRTAWEAGIAGLFPCARAPMEVPERLGNDPSKADLRARNRMAAMAHRDREQNRPRRVRIERSLQTAEELAGRTVWQPIHADSRGRLYCGNRHVTHQGPDYEKACLSFARKGEVTNDGMAWLFKAAAGHYGMSRDHWTMRQKWGEKNKQRMLAAAADPLGKLELWRDASDPWQFLQMCRALQEALDTGRTGVPIRLDQTTSGCGILSTLVRDAKVARMCNVIGKTPHDLYSHIAERVCMRLGHDLQLGDDKQKALAEVWLRRGIDRKLVKGPVLAAPYGGSYMSLCDGLVDALDMHLGYVPLDEYALQVAVPAKYLASHMWAELKAVVGPCLEVKAWLRKVCRKVMTAGYPLEWTTGMNWPMRKADRVPKKRVVQTLLFGKRMNLTLQDQPVDAGYSATQANKGIGADFTHGIDAALAHQIIYTCAVHGVPVLANHDCFATRIDHATFLHTNLLDGFASFNRVNWLAVAHEEFQLSSGLSLPAPPLVGTLLDGLIGSNSYLYS